MAKKLLVLLLSLVMVVSQIFSAGTLITGAESANQWVQDFENYNSAGVEIFANQMSVAELPETVPAREESVGGRAAKSVSSATTTNHLCLFPGDDTAKLLAGKTYTVSYWVYVVQKPGNYNLVLRGLTTNNSGYESGYKVLYNVNPSSEALVTGQWQKRSCDITPDRDSYLSFSNWLDGAAELYIDDLTVREKLSSVTVSFESNGGTPVSAVSGNPGSVFTLPEAPVQEGYKLQGWYTDPSFAMGSLFTGAVFPETDTVLYAKWIPENTWIQDFENYDSGSLTGCGMEIVTLPPSVPVREGGSGNKAAHHSGTGTVFQCLFPNDATAKLEADKTYKLEYWIYIETVPSSFLQLALQSQPMYNAGWTQDGRTTIAAKQIGNHAGSIGTWMKISYEFSGYDGYLIHTDWKNATAASYYIDDVTLTVAAGKTSVRFEPNNGQSMESLSGNAGAPLTMPADPVFTGKIFDGWYTDPTFLESTRFSSSVFPAEDVTLYAKWYNGTTWVQDFEAYPSGDYGTMEVTDLPADVPVRQGASGAKALHYSGSATTFQYIFADHFGAVLEADKGYELEYWVYVKQMPAKMVQIALKSGLPYNTYWTPSGMITVGGNGIYQIAAGAANTGVWLKRTVTIIGHAGYLCFNAFMVESQGEFYIDDVTLRELADVTVSFEANNGETLAAMSGFEGSALALPTPAKEGYSFLGWYTDPALTVPFTAAVFPAADVTLYAKYGLQGVWTQDFEHYTPSGNLTTGDFSVYTAQNANDPKVHGGSKALYRPETGAPTHFAVLFPQTARMESGHYYKLEAWVNVTSASGAGQLRLTFLEDNTDAYSWGEGRRCLDIKSYDANTGEKGVYHKVELIFTSRFDAYAGLYTYGDVEMYIDDVTLTEVPGSTITFDPRGGSAIAPMSGSVGEKLTAFPVTVKDGYNFEGWYVDSALTQKYYSETFGEQDITLYAKWNEKGVWTQDFEGFIPFDGAFAGNMSLYRADRNGDANVHSGKTALYRPLENSSYFSLLFPGALKLEAGECYKITFWTKVIQCQTGSEVRMTFLEDNTDAYSWGAERRYSSLAMFVPSNFDPKKTEWVKHEKIFVCLQDMYLGLYSYGAMEVYLDDFTVTKMPDGVIDANYPDRYSDSLYNEINFCEGKEQLETKSSGKQIIPFALDARGDYVFTATVNGKHSSLALAWDENGTDIMDGTEITSGTKTVRFMTDKSGMVYLVIQNGDGANAFSDVLLAKTKHLHAEKTVVNGFRHMSADQLPELSTLLLDEEGAADDGDTAPDTGSSFPVLPIVLLAGAAVILLMTGKRREEKHNA